MSSASATENPSILEGRGHPVHGRSLEIEVFEHDRGRLAVKGVIVDLRKQGFVPTGGDLQASGVIHHMRLDAIVDSTSLMLESLESAQPIVAYESSPETGGESCRDVAWRIPKLAGRPIDASFAKWLSSGFGGALGCSHLLALARLLISTVPQALALEKEQIATTGGKREEGERLFKRTLVLDGFEYGDGDVMQVIAQLTDIHTRPREQAQGLLGRLASLLELRLLADVEMSSLSFQELGGEWRSRTEASMRQAQWQNLAAELAPLQGEVALHGLSHKVLELFGSDSEVQPLRDVLLSVGPTLIQCMGSMAGRMMERGPGQDGNPIGRLGGMSDSCYIWRAGGPGQRRQENPDVESLPEE